MSSTCNLLDALLLGSVTSGNPYNIAIIFCGFLVILTFVVSTLTKNYSQVDKLWSIVPVIYSWIPVCDDRTLLMAIVSTIWGVRLTWNFNRRGGYQWPPWKGDEDYRWAEIQKGHFIKVLMYPIPWAIFNFAFISLYQNFLLLLIVYPSFVSYTVATECNPKGLEVIDVIATILSVSFILVETIADNQQYKFQTEKYRRRNIGEQLSGDFADGFNQSGLFAIVRKPNYGAEQAIWISFYLFSIGATDQIWNWSCFGWIMLCILFQVSGWFTEKLTLSKYPKYNEFINRVPLYLPNPFLMMNSKKRIKKI